MRARVLLVLALALSACRGVAPTVEQTALISKVYGSLPIRVVIPDCAEDEPYLRGVGDFDGHRWDRYVCVHADEVSR